MERIDWEEEEEDYFIAKDGKKICFSKRSATINEHHYVQCSKFSKTIHISLIETSPDVAYQEKPYACPEYIIKTWKVPIPNIRQKWTEIKREIFDIVGASEYGA